MASTAVTNLLKGESGTYYARVRIMGKLHWRTLDTKSYSVAKLRLPDFVSEMRRALGAEATGPQVSPKITFGEATELYKASVNSNPRLRPSTKEFRFRLIMTLRRTWPELFEMELRRVTPEACQAWLNRFENGSSTYRPTRAKKTVKGNSPTTINSAISFLRHVFDIGAKAGLIYRNPALVLKRKPPSRKLLRLPNRTQFAQIITHIRKEHRWGAPAADLVEGLAYSGMRKGESQKFCWGHVDFEKDLLTILGEKTENAPRVIPMNPDFRALLVRMLGERRPPHGERVFKARSAVISLTRACQSVGVPRMTHHDLRHLFATTCIESGVDIPTVAGWLGHSDGGALAMKTYGHIRPEHSVQAAKKVSFAPPLEQGTAARF